MSLDGGRSFLVLPQADRNPDEHVQCRLVPLASETLEQILDIIQRAKQNHKGLCLLIPEPAFARPDGDDQPVYHTVHVPDRLHDEVMCLIEAHAQSRK